MLDYPSYSTKATEALCQEIAQKSKGVCFLGFSRGKDSLCSWLYLRKFFKRIIPFHCATLPHLRFAEETLRYYEDAFDCHILRMMDTNMMNDLLQGIYQLREDSLLIQHNQVHRMWHPFNKLELVDYLRSVYNLPKAWCAFGIQASDSIDRHIYCSQYQGKNQENKSFYPCWDWSRMNVYETVKESGLLLSSEYRYLNRTIEGTPNATWTTILRDHYPEDYLVLKTYYPLCDAKVYREELNKSVLDALREERVKKNGGKADE